MVDNIGINFKNGSVTFFWIAALAAVVYYVFGVPGDLAAKIVPIVISVGAAAFVSIVVYGIGEIIDIQHQIHYSLNCIDTDIKDIKKDMRTAGD